jgi:hypothetical protein
MMTRRESLVIFVFAPTVLALALAGVVLMYFVLNHRYTAGDQGYFQLKSNIAKGDWLQEDLLDVTPIPPVLVPAFRKAGAIANDPEGRILSGAKAPRQMHAGEFLFYRDFVSSDLSDVNIPPRFELVSAPVKPENDFGEMLQPGAYIAMHGPFNESDDPKAPALKVYTVLENAKVLAIDGSTSRRTAGTPAPTGVQVLLRIGQAKEWAQIAEACQGHRFTLSVLPQPADNPNPEFTAEIQDYLRRHAAAK